MSDPTKMHWWKAACKMLILYMACSSILVFTGAMRVWFTGPFAELPGILLAALMTYFLVWLFIRWDGDQLASIGMSFSKNSSFQRLATGAAMGFSIAFAQVTILHALGLVKLELTSLNSCQLLSAPLLFLVAGMREEFLFRGYALRRLADSLGPWMAQGLVALLFILEHRASGADWTSAVLGAGAGALLFGVASLASRGLALPLGIHIAFNTGQWIVGFKEQPGIWKAIAPRGAEHQAYWTSMTVYLALVLLSAILIIFHYRSFPYSAPKQKS